MYSWLQARRILFLDRSLLKYLLSNHDVCLTSIAYLKSGFSIGINASNSSYPPLLSRKAAVVARESISCGVVVA